MNKIKKTLNKKGIFLISTLLFLVVCSAKAQQTPERISLSFSNIELSDAIKRVESATSYTFFYDVNQTNLTQKVSLNVTQKEIKEVMTSLLASTNLTFEITNKQIALMPKATPGGTKTKTVRGTVIDDQGIPVIGANVSVKGTTIGSITDIDGNYILEVPEKGTLQVSYIGYISQEESVGNKDVYNITLFEDSQTLDEIVVVGYGTARKRDIVSAMANVKGTAFSSASTSNVKDVLQGKIAGVDVQSSRYPGDDQGILIRGARSLNAGNNPLIIVDGIPGSLSNVNTYDIESIEVLKDAASSAIYGSMGANGVILVTTKRGEKGVSREVNFNAYLGVNVPHMMPLQSGEEYVQFRRDGYRYAHGWDQPYADGDIFTESELAVIANGNYTDWQDLLYRNALTQSYHLSIANSGEKTKLFLSLKYDKEEGYYETNDMDNINISLTSDHELASFWTIGTTVRLRRNNVSDFRLSHKDRQNDTEVLYMTPLSEAYNEDGTINYFPNPLNTSGYNPLSDYVPGQYADDKQTNTLNLNFTSNVRFAKWLTMQTNVGFTFSDYKRGYFFGKNSYLNKGVKTNSGKDYNNSDQYTINNILSYDNTFGDHHLTVDLVGEVQKWKYDNAFLSGDNQAVEYTTYHMLDSNVDNIKIKSEYREWALASGLVRARYNYKNKYFLNVAIRADGSSRLAKGNQWAYFPSGGVGWSIKDEAFMADVDWINNLKLRFSYGTVGNTAIDPYQTQASLSQYSYLFGEDAANKFYVYSPSSIVNRDLGWEITKTFNAGLDFGFLNNMVNGYVEVYQARTSDLLMKRAIPTFTGFDQTWQNIGKTENRGLEIGLNYSPVRSKDLTVDLSFNAARNWEKILELISGEDLPNNKWFIGKPLGVYYDYEKIGIWQLGEEEAAAKYNASVGDIKIKDQDGDGSISAANDRVILGQIRPKWTASFGGSIQYKSLDFSFNINSRWGYLVKPRPYDDITMDGQRWLPAVNYWTPDNPTNDYPRADQASGYDTYRNSNGYQKGDHIKLQDITIGYSFDRLLSKYIPVQKTRFYFQMRNVAYLYRAADYDIIPEAPNFNFTVPSSFNFGVNITF